MQIQLNFFKTVKEVKKEFHDEFPFLKIEFFNVPHATAESSSLNKKVRDDTSLVDVAGVMKEGEIAVNGDDTVKKVEQLFQHGFGLPVQVFRQYNDTWIETTASDYETLEALNEKGRQTTNRFIHPETGDRYIEEREY